MPICPEAACRRCASAGRLTCRLAREARATHDIHRLSALSDAALRDIALDRGDIRSAVRGDRTR